MAFISPTSRLYIFILMCVSIFVLAVCGPATAQQDQKNSNGQALPQRETPAEVEALGITDRESTPAGPSHPFFDKRNVLLFSGVAAFRVLDYTSTRNMLARGREEKLIPDDVVHSTPGFVSLEAAGAATSIGIAYFLHRTGHHKLERWLSIGHIGVTGFGVVRNYALESRHP